MNSAGWLVLFGAAILEVAGDALIRHGVKGGGWVFVGLGFLTLAFYGWFVNLDKTIDFSRLMGLYVAAFAVVGVLCGRIIFRETISNATWAGLSLIILGGFVMQIGGR